MITGDNIYYSIDCLKKTIYLIYLYITEKIKINVN